MGIIACKLRDYNHRLYTLLIPPPQYAFQSIFTVALPPLKITYEANTNGRY